MTQLSTHDWPAEYIEFIRLYNDGEYYDAHEVLEDLWAIEVPPLKDFYKGLIQLAAAFVHWEKGNIKSTMRMWTLAQGYLTTYPEHFEGLQLKAVLGELETSFSTLSVDKHTHTLDRQRIPRLVLSDEFSLAPA